MKNKKIILAIGILIGTLILVQILVFDKPKSPEVSATTTNIETIQQKNMMVNTAIYYVLSFINHN
ncbi:MAG: hypothetical protein OEX22_11475 [Cyclobacteriaceae bacterium]|nr:hypothetical protein [Cyclobacteriaceae bacterium]